MGYDYLGTAPENSRKQRLIALEVIFQSMGKWLPGHSRRYPEIEVSVISSLFRITRPAPLHGWRRWIRRLGIF